eukprot:2836526-Alexandrium_andersonii.AAC.1
MTNRSWPRRQLQHKRGLRGTVYTHSRHTPFLGGAEVYEGATALQVREGAIALQVREGLDVLEDAVPRDR